MNLTNEQKEDLRGAALQALAVRHPAALTPRQVFHAVKKELPFLFEEGDLAAALELLRGLRLCEWIISEFGGTKYWRATSDGVLHYERA
jgi:hypothetical protein